jgi:hypothetical protein
MHTYQSGDIGRLGNVTCRWESVTMQAEGEGEGGGGGGGGGGGRQERGDCG